MKVIVDTREQAPFTFCHERYGVEAGADWVYKNLSREWRSSFPVCRNVVCWRRLVRDYERRLDVSESIIQIAMASILLKRFIIYR